MFTKSDGGGGGGEMMVSFPTGDEARALCTPPVDFFATGVAARFRSFLARYCIL